MRAPVRKAVIPAAGFGTRMLPATKSIPKELLTIVDRPMLDYIVEEAFASGIEHVVIVTGRMKCAIEDHFDHGVRTRRFAAPRRQDSAWPTECLAAAPRVGSISFVRQQEARGLGHAVWTRPACRSATSLSRCCLPDMLMTEPSPASARWSRSTTAAAAMWSRVEKCRPEEAHKFGIVSLKPTANGPLVNGLVEKPAPGTAPTNLYISGRYILQPEIFGLLENQEPGAAARSSSPTR